MINKNIEEPKLTDFNCYRKVKKYKNGDVISMKIEQMTRMGKCVGSVAVKINNAMYCFGTDKLRIAASKAITMYLKEYRIKPSKHKPSTNRRILTHQQGQDIAFLRVLRR